MPAPIPDEPSELLLRYLPSRVPVLEVGESTSDESWLSLRVEDEAFHITLELGRLLIAPGHARAWVSVVLGRPAFRALVVEAIRAVDASGRLLGFSALAPPGPLERRRSALAQIHSTIAYEAIDGDVRHRALVRLDGAEPSSEPDATIACTLADHHALAVGHLRPHQALFGGRFQISGDPDVPIAIFHALATPRAAP